jgi:hypothetical protein
MYRSAIFEVFRNPQIEKSRFLGENGLWGSGRVPEFFARQVLPVRDDSLIKAFNGQPLKATMPCEKGGHVLTKPVENGLHLLAEVGQVSQPVISIRVKCLPVFMTDLETCPRFKRGA